MQLQDYFEKASGVGVMSTADSGGKVDSGWGNLIYLNWVDAAECCAVLEA